jgi:hypothetical protein
VSKSALDEIKFCSAAFSAWEPLQPARNEQTALCVRDRRISKQATFAELTTMNWEMISAVGQMLGAIGVIISIVYLAAQIRNQNKESRRAAMNVLTTHWSDLNRSLVENPELAALWIRALRSFDELDGASKLRFGAHLGRFLRFADSLDLGVLDGTLDKRLWCGYERTLADTVAYPGFQTWWATRKHWHTDEFCALIDRHIQTAKPNIYDGYT